MRSRTDPATAAELAAVDAALEGRREDPEVAAITAEARASAPRMSPAFAERLEQAARDGFAPQPSRNTATPRGARWWTAPRLGLAMSAVAAVAVVVVVAGSGGGSPSRPDTFALTGGEKSAAPEAASGGGSAASGASSASGGSSASADAAAPSAVGRDAGPAPRRRVERAAQLTVAVPNRKLQPVVDDVAAIANRLGGFVATSNVSAAGSTGQADFDLRVPVGRLDEALAAISRLGHVRARSSQVRDVTASYTSARAALIDAKAEREALLRALARATTQPEIDSLHARLAIARRQIDRTAAALHVVRRRAALARIAVTVVGVHRGAVAAPASHRWTPGRALHDAVRVLSTVASVAIVSLAGGLPLLLLGLLCVAAYRATTRRRRERALDTVNGRAASV